MKSPAAFVKSLTFEKVLAAFEKTTGLTVQNGGVAKLPRGERSVALVFAAGLHAPFAVTAGSQGRIKIERGFVTYAGTTYYLPAAVYSGASPGGVFLKMETHYTATFVAEGEPWLVTPVPSTPTLVWRPANALGNHCQLTQLNDPDDPNDDEYAIGVGSSQTVYIPIATETDGQVLSLRTQNIFLLPTSYGPLDYYYGWG